MDLKQKAKPNRTSQNDYGERNEVDVEMVRTRDKMAADLEKRYGEAIVVNSDALYAEESSAIGVAVLFLDCDCVVLRGFQEDGEVVGNPRILRKNGSCGSNHAQQLNGISKSVVHRSIRWKDGREEFDRKYGNEKI